jgi:hypothetical protein
MGYYTTFYVPCQPLFRFFFKIFSKSKLPCGRPFLSYAVFARLIPLSCVFSSRHFPSSFFRKDLQTSRIYVKIWERSLGNLRRKGAERERSVSRPC